jgi:hypothetical protein
MLCRDAQIPQVVNKVVWAGVDREIGEGKEHPTLGGGVGREGMVSR